MLQIHTCDYNYQTYMPIYFGSYGMESGRIKTLLSEYRELDLSLNHNLNHSYNYLRTDQEAKLKVNINGHTIGFSKAINKVTHLLVIADTGSGSSDNTAFGLENPRAAYIDNEYKLIAEETALLNNKIIYYIVDKNYTGGPKYYEIKVFGSNVEESEESNTDYTQEDIYTLGVNFLKSNSKKISIDQQINRQEGSSDIHFYSSSLEIKKHKRTVPFNSLYKGYTGNLLNQLSPKFEFKLIGDDKLIKLQTGVVDNYDLLNMTCRSAGWQWREDGLLPDGTTRILCGEFDTLPAINKASFSVQDNWFKPSAVVIDSIRELYPTLDINIRATDFVLEGSKIDIRYRDHIQNLFKVPIDELTIDDSRVFMGFNNYEDLYKFI